jgi:mono/diheme cytochrome c family protein
VVVNRALAGGARLAVILGLTAALWSHPLPAAAQCSGCGVDHRGMMGGAAPEAASANADSAGKTVVTPQAREQAAQIFEERCQSCHGPEGHGDGPAAGNLKPRPRDFHNRRWQKAVTDAEITKAIVYGGSSVGLSGEMAPNPDLENEPAIVSALVERIRKLAK